MGQLEAGQPHVCFGSLGYHNPSDSGILSRLFHTYVDTFDEILMDFMTLIITLVYMYQRDFRQWRIRI